jgi:hypothetical protein
MNKKTFIRIGFLLFLFVIGYLVGAGFGKTVRYLAGKDVKEAKSTFHVHSSNKS